MRKILFFVVTILSFAMSVCAQSVQEPDFEFEPFVANLQDSTLGDPLPCENSYIKAKAGASMYIVGIGR